MKNVICNCKDEICLTFHFLVTTYSLHRKSCVQSTYIENFVLNNKEYLTFENICYISPVNGKIELLAVYYFVVINGKSSSIFTSEQRASYLLSLSKDPNTESIHLYSKLPLTLTSHYRER